MKKSEEYKSYSSAETHQIALLFGKRLQPNAIIAFTGDLGSGKTTFIQGLAEGASSIVPREVSSPTFNYLNIYSGLTTIYHFDLYRLRSSKEFLLAGFEDYLQAGGICCIEWSERITSILPSNTTCIQISHLGENTRKIEIYE